MVVKCKGCEGQIIIDAETVDDALKVFKVWDKDHDRCRK